MNVILDIALVSLVTFSVFSNLVGFPGNLLVSFSSLFYGISTGFDNFSFVFVLGLFGIVLLLEFLEFLLIFFTARRYGSSKWGISGAVIGGILGALAGASFSPILGAVIGSFAGVFIGACGLEFAIKRKLKPSIWAGFGAFLGKLGGLSIKMIGGTTMAIMVLSRVL
jgi:uncharacterized protein YqgC (DUF456 family)